MFINATNKITWQMSCADQRREYLRCWMFRKNKSMQYKDLFYNTSTLSASTATKNKRRYTCVTFYVSCLRRLPMTKAQQIALLVFVVDPLTVFWTRSSTVVTSYWWNRVVLQTACYSSTEGGSITPQKIITYCKSIC